MNFVNCVSVQVKPGLEQQFEETFREMTALTRQEPGCIDYQLHRSISIPGHYFIYEKYIDELAYNYHCSTEYFEIVAKNIVPTLVEKREVVKYLPVVYV